jgi:chromosome segregation ATPase
MLVEQFLDLVTNVEAYKAKLKELKDAEESARQVIELVGPVKDIHHLRATAREEIGKAQQLMKEAREKIAEERESMKAEIQQRWDELSKKQTELALREKAVFDDEEALAKHRETVKKEADKVSERNLTVGKLFADLQERERLLEAKLAKLKAIV